LPLSTLEWPQKATIRAINALMVAFGRGFSRGGWAVRMITGGIQFVAREAAE